jgi:2-polyprenyl-3-methyl-5-hydroxy-6-metoxy-1,4-benzoquinol methylase
MPVNYLHSLFHRVESGWDPISREYAQEYADFTASQRDVSLVESLELKLGGLRNRRVLDLGGGPGQYSVLFAQRGADVTWHDISRTYRDITEARANALGVQLRYSLGYLENAARLSSEPFDLVFCRVCWSYGRSDRRFARLVYSLVKPGGVGYIECNTPEFSKPSGVRRLQYWLNEFTGWKIGHPMPPRGRIAKLIQGYPISSLSLNYSSPLLDVVEFWRAEQ